MKRKLLEWANRYVPAEIAAIITAIAGATIGFVLSHGNGVAAAFCGAMGENVGYYGVILFRDIRSSSQKLKRKGKRYGKLALYKNIRNILVEFGPAEVLDSFVIRPFWMWVLPTLLNNFTLGIIVAKFAADITFYASAIMSYELRKKYLKD